MKLIILDRDGVINFDSEHYIKSPDEWLAIPGSLEAIGQLKQLGYIIAIATNQSGIARGLYSEETLAAIHDKMQMQLAEYGGKIDFIAYCPHHPDDKCNCRKPKLEMLKKIQHYFYDLLYSQSINMLDFKDHKQKDIYFVGDSYCDIEAAQAMQFVPVLVKTGNGRETVNKLKKHNGIAVYENLAAFVKNILD